MYADKPEIRVSGEPHSGVSEARFDEFLMSGLYGVVASEVCERGMSPYALSNLAASDDGRPSIS